MAKPKDATSNVAKSAAATGKGRAGKTIAPATGDKEPLKANVFDFVQNSVTALAPLFPYFDEGSIVPCVASFRGGPGKRFGRFQHLNTVDEVVIAFGPPAAPGKSGFVRVGPRLHQVGAPFEDVEDPDNLRIVTITQRQLFGKPQEEEVRFVCENCNRLLFTARYDATPPRRGGQRDALGPHAPFATIPESYEAAKAFNDDAALRHCDHCGHENPPFPIEAWGWDAYVRQSEIARIAHQAVTAEAAESGTASA